MQLLDSPNRIASGSEDKRLRFWEFTKGKWRLAHSAKAHTEGNAPCLHPPDTVVDVLTHMSRPTTNHTQASIASILTHETTTSC